ncbi:ABC transporter ATP-binding protein [Vibrio sp. RC27]
MNYVEIIALEKAYGDTPIFQDINFTINQGEFITLLGPSGCGKSTLLRCLAGLTPVNSGEIYINGNAITHAKPQQRDIGMVFQSYALFPNMTTWDNIAFGLKMHKVDSSDIERRVRRVVELVELGGREQHYPHQLSGGQKQRVALARALVVQPKILLLDEPLSALDARIRRSLREQIREIQKEMGLTTIFVTHDQEEALTLSDRIFLMDKGNIVQSGSAESIYTKPANSFVAGFMGSYNLLNAQQVHTLFGQSITGQLAIRPESIYIKEPGAQYAKHISKPVSAKVVNHQLLGNVIRYRVQTEAGELTIDTLNRSPESLISSGSTLDLLFNEQEMQLVA